jgi:hypothetical protein
MDEARLATIVGMAIMLAAVSLLNAAMVMQKMVLDRLPPFETERLADIVGRLFRSPLWLVGRVLNVVAVVLNMVALSAGVSERSGQSASGSRAATAWQWRHGPVCESARWMRSRSSVV